jgi:hypothetical protein
MLESVLTEKDEVQTHYSHEVFDSILQLNLRNCHITVCLASFAGNEAFPRFEKLDVYDNVESEFRSIIEKLIKKYQKERYTNGLLFPEFAPSSKPPPYEIEHFELSEHKIILEQINPLKALTEIDVFEEDKSFVSALRFYVLIIQTPDGEPIYCFRFHTLHKTLAQERYLTICKRNGSLYNQIEEPVFLFDQEIDCICRSGVMFIFNKSNFEQMFQFLEELKEIAKETLDNLKLRIPIKNFDDLLRACQGNLLKMRKLKNVAAQPYINKITIEHIKMVITDNKLSIKTEVIDGQEMIVYDEKEPWLILNLLDDAYLRSLLTDQRYQVDGKRKLSK